MAAGVYARRVEAAKAVAQQLANGGGANRRRGAVPLFQQRKEEGRGRGGFVIFQNLRDLTEK